MARFEHIVRTIGATDRGRRSSRVLENHENDPLIRLRPDALPRAGRGEARMTARAVRESEGEAKEIFSTWV